MVEWYDAGVFGDTFSAAPILIAYYATTGIVWWYFIIPFCVVGVIFTCVPNAIPAEEIEVPRHWAMLLLELCLFFILGQGVSSDEVQPDGFRSSYMYIPIVVSWISMAIPTVLSRHVSVAIDWAQVYVYLLLTIHAASTPSSGRNADPRLAEQIITLLLLCFLYALPSRSGAASTPLRSLQVMVKVFLVLFASGMLQLQHKDASSPDFDTGVVDFRILREATSMGAWRHAGFLGRVAVLLSAGRHARGCMEKLSDDLRPLAVLTVTMTSCAVANYNDHFLLWAMVIHLSMLAWAMTLEPTTMRAWDLGKVFASKIHPMQGD